MIPEKIGRKLSKESKGSGGNYTQTIASFNKGKRDFMDRFLLELQKKHRDDLDNLEELGRFDVKAHYLDGIYITNNEVEKFSIVEKESELQDAADFIIDSMMEKICKRAKAIVGDEETCDNLYTYFVVSNLIK